MTGVRFREAVEAELAAVVSLLEDDRLGQAREGAAPEVYRAAFREMRAHGSNRLIVGLRGDRIVATYQLTIIPGISLRAARRAQIEGVRVASDLRGEGIGGAMIADAEARARAAGCRLMQLTMNAERGDTARFYARHGFAPTHVGFKRAL